MNSPPWRGKKLPQEFQWFWLDGFGCLPTGQTDWWLIPRVKTESGSRVLPDFAPPFGVRTKQQLVWVLEQAR